MRSFCIFDLGRAQNQAQHDRTVSPPHFPKKLKRVAAGAKITISGGSMSMCCSVAAPSFPLFSLFQFLCTPLPPSWLVYTATKNLINSRSVSALFFSRFDLERAQQQKRHDRTLSSASGWITEEANKPERVVFFDRKWSEILEHVTDEAIITNRSIQ